MDDVRKWFHYPIEMPVTAAGEGPATVGLDAAKITYEVWDQLLFTHASFDNLPDAINEAMRLNAALTPASDGRAEALREAIAEGMRIATVVPVEQVPAAINAFLARAAELEQADE